MTTKILNITIEDVELVVSYSYSPATAGKLSGPWEDCYPPEDEDIEIEAVCLDSNEVDIFELLSHEVINKITGRISIREFENREECHD